MRAISPHTVGLALMSWRGADVLARTLESYKQGNLFPLFDKTLLLFQDISDDDKRTAARYNLNYISTDSNVGIENGIRLLAESMDTDYILLLENDCPLIEPHEQAVAQLTLACKRLATHQADIYRLRHRWQPGEKFNTVDKYRRYHLVPGEKPSLAKSLLRTLRPNKYRRLIGTAPYLHEMPLQKGYERYLKIQPEGDIIVSSAVLNWTNQSVLLSRSFLLDTLLPYARAHPSSRNVNGFPDLERALNCRWWRKRDFKIAIGRGLFTHKRL
jgi:hypothetical protein